MSQYSDYFDRQTPSPALHQKLLELKSRKKRRARTLPLAVCAACCLVALGLWLVRGPGAILEQKTEAAATPTPQSTAPSAPTSPSPRLPALQYSSSSGEMAANIALPDGHFQEDLTTEDLTLLFGETGWWEDLGWTLSGYAVYDGQGQLWQVFLSGSREEGTGNYCLALTPNQLPPACVVAEPQGINDVWGTEVSATRTRYDCDGDSVEEACYTLTFLREETLGARLELQDEDGEAGQAMIDGILSRLLDPQRSVSLDSLTPEKIPAWRYERLTLEEARQEPDFAAYFPGPIPHGFQAEGAWLDLGQDRYSLSLCWSRGSETISVCINRMPEAPASQFADLQEPASYDLRLYPVPRGDSIPDAYWDSVQDPIFRAEDVTRELLEARADFIADEGKTHFQFQILHAEGVLVQYSLDLSLTELWAMVEPTLPGA